MPIQHKDHRRPSGLILLLSLLATTIVVCSIFTYRPDRPLAPIAPGSSSGPAFVVQVIRPRLGLPLGGILPPEVFGLEANLTFDSTTPGATVGAVGPDRIELAANEWELVLVRDAAGRVSPESYVIFQFIFEDRLRRVRCSPGDPAVGTLDITPLAATGQLSGSFDIELAHCEDAGTGKSLGWPPRPLVLYGSFDRLPLQTETERP